MSLYPLLLVLCLFGSCVTVYLIWSRKKNEHPVCLIGKKCHVVLESKYNHLFGFQNDVMGLFFYISMLVLATLLHFDFGPSDLIFSVMKLSVFAASVVAGVFLYLQWKVLKAWCFWCIVSNTNTWLMAFIILFYL